LIGSIVLDNSIVIDIENIEDSLSTLSFNIYTIFSSIFFILLLLMFLNYKLIFVPQMRLNKQQIAKEQHDKDYLDTIIESNNNAIIAIDSEQKILTYNKKAQEMFGYTKEEMLGTKNLLFIIPNKYKKIHTTATKKYFETGKSMGLIGSTIELEGLTKDKKVFPILVSFGKNSSVKNRIVVANIADLSFEKNIQKEHDQLKANFIANISHEIRTPMNGIISMTHLALKTDVTEQQKYYLNNIEQSSTLLLNLINNILDFSNIKDGKIETDKINFNFHNLLETLKLHSISKEIEFEVKYDKDIPQYLYGDVLKIEKILHSLVDNAVKFTTDGFIKIIITHQKNLFTFKVQDSGIGISKDEQKKLFKSFSQVDTSDSRKYNGTGLGLALAKQLVELMNGKIWVKSELGKGSSFIFTLPLEEIKESLSEKKSNKQYKKIDDIISNNPSILPLFQHINSEIGLTHLAQNSELYKDILIDFYNNYKQFQFQFSDIKKYKMQIHILKTLSASIGAEKLYTNLLKIEKEDQNKNFLQDFSNELEAILSELSILIKKDNEENNSQKETLNPESREKLLLSLKDVLKTKKPKKCEVVIKEIEKYKLEEEDNKLFNKIKVLVKKYKFKDAMELLNVQ